MCPGTSGKARLEVKDLGAHVDMAALNIEVKPDFWRLEDLRLEQGRSQVLDAATGKARQWIMNKLLSIFADSLREKVPLSAPNCHPA